MRLAPQERQEDAVLAVREEPRRDSVSTLARAAPRVRGRTQERRPEAALDVQGRDAPHGGVGKAAQDLGDGPGLPPEVLVGGGDVYDHRPGAAEHAPPSACRQSRGRPDGAWMSPLRAARRAHLHVRRCLVRNAPAGWRPGDPDPEARVTQREIEAERDRLLAAAGFEDIERPDGSIALPSDILRHVHRTEDLEDTS